MAWIISDSFACLSYRTSLCFIVCEMQRKQTLKPPMKLFLRCVWCELWTAPCNVSSRFWLYVGNSYKKLHFQFRQCFFCKFSMWNSESPNSHHSTLRLDLLEVGDEMLPEFSISVLWKWLLGVYRPMSEWESSNSELLSVSVWRPSTTTKSSGFQMILQEPASWLIR